MPRLAKTFAIACLLVLPGSHLAAQSAVPYFPDRFEWQHKKPEEVGMDAARLDEAVKQAIATENPATKNMVLFLTTLVGLAWQRRMIRDVNDYARDYMPAGVDLFEAPHNQTIKWDHLLRQTRDWQGKLWEPGTHYKYNDARVNVLALATLNVWRRPLQEVLREEIMEPIGASSTWRWHGYENSWVEIDGRKIQSVTGGGHWGGGMFINAYDMARFGYVFLRNGKWKDRALVSEKWIEMARKPG